MTDLVKFNVGGKRYEVSRSLLEMRPDTMLARSASEQWQKDPKAEIFLERDGHRFRHCLDYMRDGEVSVPHTVSREAVLMDLAYYGFEDVNKGKVDLNSANCAQMMIHLSDESEVFKSKANYLDLA